MHTLLSTAANQILVCMLNCSLNYRYSIFDDRVKKQDTLLIAGQRLQGIAVILSSNSNDEVYFMSAIQDTAGHLWLVTYYGSTMVKRRSNTW